jgi:hypothetical protein
MGHALCPARFPAPASTQLGSATLKYAAGSGSVDMPATSAVNTGVTSKPSSNYLSGTHHQRTATGHRPYKATPHFTAKPLRPPRPSRNKVLNNVTGTTTTSGRCVLIRLNASKLTFAAQGGPQGPPSQAMPILYHDRCAFELHGLRHARGVPGAFCLSTALTTSIRSLQTCQDVSL